MRSSSRWSCSRCDSAALTAATVDNSDVAGFAGARATSAGSTTSCARRSVGLSSAAEAAAAAGIIEYPEVPCLRKARERMRAHPRLCSAFPARGLTGRAECIDWIDHYRTCETQPHRRTGAETDKRLGWVAARNLDVSSMPAMHARARCPSYGRSPLVLFSASVSAPPRLCGSHLCSLLV